ncbi:hypothetical protein G6F31_016283 [Rhizopus arrhizus]|nr:hypothetical protein G6F31_016283 [Rhizopus arrhizus]
MRRALDLFRSALETGGDTITPDFQFHLLVAQSTDNRYFADLMSHLGSAIIPRTRINSAKFAHEDRAAYLARPRTPAPRAIAGGGTRRTASLYLKYDVVQRFTATTFAADARQTALTLARFHFRRTCAALGGPPHAPPDTPVHRCRPGDADAVASGAVILDVGSRAGRRRPVARSVRWTAHRRVLAVDGDCAAGRVFALVWSPAVGGPHHCVVVPHLVDAVCAAGSLHAAIHR